MTQPIAFVGAATSDYPKTPGKHDLELHGQAATRALTQAGLTLADVDGFGAVTNAWLRQPAVYVAEYLGLRPRWIDSTSTGGSSFVDIAGHAADALRAGRCSVVLITYGSTQYSSRGRQLGTGGMSISPFADQFEGAHGMNLVSSYALSATRHMNQYGTTAEQLARIAVAARRWAGMNTSAMYRDPITVDDVLASPMIAEPLHRLDCCVVSDGGGAVVLTTADRAKDMEGDPIWLLGQGEASTHLHISEMEDMTVTSTALSAADAFRSAGVAPADMDLAMLYDSFTITELLQLEDAGFCPKGEGGAFAESGALDPGGSLPTNTDGGGLSSCHPGMRGMFLMVEAVRQLRGQALEAQVPGARLAFVNGVGGWLSSSASLVLSSERP